MCRETDFISQTRESIIKDISSREGDSLGQEGHVQLLRNPTTYVLPESSIDCFVPKLSKWEGQRSLKGHLFYLLLFSYEKEKLKEVIFPRHC